MKNLFDIGYNSLGNEPTDDEIRFISKYIERQFLEIENINLSTITKEEGLDIFLRIKSIKNAISDLLSPDGGNYYKLLKGLNTKINFENRLSVIFSKMSKYFSIEKNIKTEFRNSSDKPVHDPRFGYKLFELNEYLDKLIQIQPLKEEEIETNADIDQTLIYLSDYLNHILSRHGKKHTRLNNQQKTVPIIFFLRDALLLYLGAKRLQAKGYSIDVKAILISRTLIDSFLPSNERNSIYKKAYNLIFKVLSDYQGNFSKEFTDKYKEIFTTSLTQPEFRLIEFINEYLNEELGNQVNFVGVDTAAHGTMPLITHVASGMLNTLEMFTSTPWLYEFYSSNIFIDNFPHMRTLESIACQEELFQFAYISKGKIYVKETCDPKILLNAKLEIRKFLSIVDQNLPMD